MSRRVVILRPQPGADTTAERARALGLEPIMAPLFTVEPLGWSPPDPARFDALMLSSANALRHAGAGLKHVAALPLFVVGEATARAARDHGLTPTHIGTRDAGALAEAIRQAGHAKVLHLCGEDVRETGGEALNILRIPVYRARASADAARLSATLMPGDMLLLHSPRAAQHLAALVPVGQRAAFSLIAISANARAAAGEGWASAQSAAAPTDAAMLALATDLCNNAPDAQSRTTRRG